MSKVRGTVQIDPLTVSYEFDQPLTRVSIYDIEYGVQATAYARVAEPDTYDEKIGYSLAYGRALRRLFSKREKRIIKSLSD